MKKIGFILLVVAAALYMGYDMFRDRGNRAEAAYEAAHIMTTPDSGKSQSVTPCVSGLDRVRISGSNPSQEKDYTGFRLSFNKDTRTPNWVAWELLGSECNGPATRSNDFWTDDDIYGCSTPEDYRRSGYDRGHICPAADQKWSKRAMSDCFVFTNMCPQNHSLNSGAWNTLENKERQWAMRDSAIVIVAGPIYTQEDTLSIGPSKVKVPGAFFKVMVAPYLEEPRGIAFIYPNMSAPGNMQNYVTTIDEVEKITGFDFFYKLPDDVENKIEATSSFREWDKR